MISQSEGGEKGALLQSKYGMKGPIYFCTIFNISDSKARSMQESRINVEVSPKLAITQSQNQAKLYVHRGYVDHGAGHPDYY